MGITPEGEQPEIKEFFTCMLTNPSYAQTTAQLEEGDLYDIAKEGEYQDYIERWFQEVTRWKYHSFIQHLLMQREVSWLKFHIQVIIATIFSYVDKGTILIFLSHLVSLEKLIYLNKHVFFLLMVGKYVYK